MGIRYTRSALDSGLIAEIEGGCRGKTVAFHADMDALAIQEETGLPFASTHEGHMHACGHDAHTAMLLGAAEVLQKHRVELKGTVRLLFQTAEEPARGADLMIKAGALQNVDAIFGLHVGTIMGREIPAGTVVAAEGCCLAAYDKFVITIKGRGVHGSTPEKGIDPVNIGSHIVLALQAITTRELAAVRPLVVTVGKFVGGSQYNVIPDEAVIEGTIRTVDEETRQFAARRIQEIAASVAATFGGTAECAILWGAPPVISTRELAQLTAAAAEDVVGAAHVQRTIPAPNMGGEDFANYLKVVPGAFFFLSSSNAEKGTDVAHHNPKFDVDEDVLWSGSATFVRIAEKFLNE